jgi:hypothetical protein
MTVIRMANSMRVNPENLPTGKQLICLRTIGKMKAQGWWVSVRTVSEALECRHYNGAQFLMTQLCARGWLRAPDETHPDWTITAAGERWL